MATVGVKGLTFSYVYRSMSIIH